MSLTPSSAGTATRELAARRALPTRAGLLTAGSALSPPLDDEVRPGVDGLPRGAVRDRVRCADADERSVPPRCSGLRVICDRSTTGAPSTYAGTPPPPPILIASRPSRPRPRPSESKRRALAPVYRAGLVSFSNMPPADGDVTLASAGRAPPASTASTTCSEQRNSTQGKDIKWNGVSGSTARRLPQALLPRRHVCVPCQSHPGRQDTAHRPQVRGRQQTRGRRDGALRALSRV